MALFDEVMPLLTEAITEADIPVVRSQMGFVNPATVTVHRYSSGYTPPDPIRKFIYLMRV